MKLFLSKKLRGGQHIRQKITFSSQAEVSVLLSVQLISNGVKKWKAQSLKWTGHVVHVHCI